jgi:putative membrane protein
MSKKAWLALIGIAVVIVLLFGGGLYLLAGRGFGFGYGMFGRGMAYGTPFTRGGGMMFGFPFIGGIGMLLFWLLIIVGAVWLISALASHNASPMATNAPAAPMVESPLDILKRRYAKGEINKEQFEEMKSTLGS